MKTTLVNFRTFSGGRCDIILIDRTSLFGNPFHIFSSKGENYTREESILKYREYFYRRIKEDEGFRIKVQELKGKKLACWCTPLPCHGDVIIEYLEKTEDGSG